MFGFLPLPKKITKMLLSLAILVASLAWTASSSIADAEDPSGASISALDQARQLKVPQASKKYGGETEHSDWWDEQAVLLQQARQQWGRKHPTLYEFDAYKFLDPALVQAVTSRNKTLFASLFQETAVTDVYTFSLLRPSFVDELRDELDHQEESGIPLRRPNGMNRYGAILSELGFADMLRSLTQEYLTLAARHLFQEFVGPDDLVASYPFTVHYEPDKDVKLSEHTDASTITVNVCLQPSSNNETVLYFKTRPVWPNVVVTPEESAAANPTYIDLAESGQAVIHLGQHTHGVSETTATREQMVVWMFGEHGYVRVAPYEPDEIASHVRGYNAFWGTETTSSVTSNVVEVTLEEL